MKSKYPGISYFVNVCGVTSVTDKNCENSGVCRGETINGKTTFISLGLVKYQNLVFDTVTNSLILKYLQDANGMLSRNLYVPIVVTGLMLLQEFLKNSLDF